MKTTFDKSKLAEIMKVNRDKHRSVFLQVMEKYREKVIQTLEERLASIKNNKPITLWFNLTEPQDQTKDYNRVISMLENSTEQDITLDEKDYSRYVLDQWDWKETWKSTSNSYGVAVED